MNPMIVFTVVMALCAMSAEAIFFGTGATAAGSIVLASGSGVAPAAAIVGGAIVLKALALGGLALAANANRRNKRSAIDEQETVFAFIAKNEPAQCYRRLICDLASGAMPESENQAILGLFNSETSAVSPKFDFAVAASLGKQLKSAEACEVTYSCPLTGQQIDKLFN